MDSVIFRTVLLVLACLACLQIEANAQEPAMVKSQSGVQLNTDVDWSMCKPEGIAVGGYDLLSYRTPGGPIKGLPAYSTEHDGQTFLFLNDSNREKFKQDPVRYLPAYSGFCAISLALGRVTCPEYTNFKIESDQLLLFETTGFTNGKTLWNSDAQVYRRQAHSNFQRLIEIR